MFPEELKKILRIVKKTGDRVIIFDAQAPSDSYVVMNLDSYSDLIDSQDPKKPFKKISEKVIQAKDKTNEAKTGRDDYKNKEESKEKDNELNNDNREDSKNLTEEDLTDKINREIATWENREEAPYLNEESKSKRAWKIPGKIKKKAQEII